MGRRLRVWSTGPGLVVGWAALLTLGISWPMLRSGYVLSYDMVAVPRQSLLPEFFGFGAGLPRAVPQDAVFALVTQVVAGEWLQKLMLLAILLLAGIGVGRLLSGFGRPWQLMGVTLAIWNPFVAERLVIGHWSLLLAYSVLPWMLAALVKIRSTDRGYIGLIWFAATGSLVPSAGILVTLLVTVPLLWPAAHTPFLRRMLTVLCIWLLNLPWVLPALMHPDSGTSAAESVAVFSLRSQGPWGELVTALSLGGIWNSEVTLASRSWWTAPVIGLVLCALAAIGARRWLRRAHDVSMAWLWILSGIGLCIALAPVWFGSAWTQVVGSVPGAGILRDSSKWLIYLAMAVAICAPVGVRYLVRRLEDPATRRAFAVLVIIVPIAAMPDFVWGATGRLSAVHYPAQWTQLREVMAVQSAPGDVLVLPWSAFRQYEFNDRRTVLDPAPRWLPRPSLVVSDLAVTTDGGVIVLPGDIRRAGEISDWIATERPLSGLPPSLGIGWVLVESGQRPEPSPASLVGLQQTWAEGDLRLYRVDSAATTMTLTAGERVVVALDAVLFGALWVALAAAGVLRWRRSHSKGRDPVVSSG